MEEQQLKPLRVSEVTRAVKTCIEGHFPHICVRGELNDITLHTSGHVYFSLKEGDCQLAGAAFRFAQKAQELHLERGMEVDVYGRLTVYEPRGTYQLQAFSIFPVGAGAFYRQFEELKARLGAEGLFDISRKRAIPSMPRVIGVVTSWNGAAILDFMRVLEHRFRWMHVRVIPTLVQGTEAPSKLIKGIEYFNRTKSCDVIVLTRGGGSVEDLWAFNDEQLARAIASSEIPVVSAVGHERDHSISDFVADYAAATPTAAAEYLIRGKAELGERLQTMERRMVDVMRLRLSSLQTRWQRAAGCPLLSHPEDWLHGLSQRLDYAGIRLKNALPGMMAMRRQRLRHAAERFIPLLLNGSRDARQRYDDAVRRLAMAAADGMKERRCRLERMAIGLEAMNPKAVLTRGYSILMDQKGHALTCASETEKGAPLHAWLHDGELAVTVTDVLTSPQEANQRD